MALLDIVRNPDGIVTATINRPDMRNPISDPDMIDAVIDGMTALDADESVRVIILTGAGSTFSSGGNLNAMKIGAGLADEKPARTRRNYRRGIQQIPLLFEALETPVIAAVNGPAIGAGCDLACMCDIRIAAQSAKFAESFVKLGLVPGDGGAWLLPRIVGFSKATEMVLTGEVLTAEEALKFGLVSRVVPDAELMPAAMSMAERIAAHPAAAVRLTKRLVRISCNASLDAVLELSASMQAIMHSTADQQEALAAMLEKRKPDYTGN